ncbi:MAG: hypothetical protein IKW74_05240, partial [Thermoguttaceae bacterium]|nr:hypothetical protein [Thermoguttaceae bacterium]
VIYNISALIKLFKSTWTQEIISLETMGPGPEIVNFPRFSPVTTGTQNEEFSENVTPGQRKIQDLFIINLFPKKEIVFSKIP